MLVYNIYITPLTDFILYKRLKVHLPFLSSYHQYHFLWSLECWEIWKDIKSVSPKGNQA